jgi:hypothetical protein
MAQVIEGRDSSLPLEGALLTRLCFDRQLHVDFDEVDVRLLVTTPFMLVGNNANHRIDPEDSRDLHHLLQLLRQRVVQAVIRADATLRVELTSGYALVVSPDPDYEAWEVSGRSGLRVVCMPGGALGIWDPTAASSEPRMQ